MDNTKQLLERLNRGEKLDSSVLERLARDGFINMADVTNMQSPAGIREFLFTSITEKGRRLIEGS